MDCQKKNRAKANLQKINLLSITQYNIVTCISTSRQRDAFLWKRVCRQKKNFYSYATATETRLYNNRVIPRIRVLNVFSVGAVRRLYNNGL
jgi:hypothetical protein